MLNRPEVEGPPADAFNDWPAGPRVAWYAWAGPALFFLFEFLVRVLPGAVEAELQAEFHTDAATFGFNMGLYYLAYAPMQIVVGLLLDRFGGRRPLVIAALVLGLGCASFAASATMGWLGVARFLMGFGSAFAYVGAIFVALQWFPGRRAALIAGVTAALGMLGAIAGQVAVTHVLELMTWRTVMWALVGVSVLLAAVMFLCIPPRPAHQVKAVAQARARAGNGMQAALRDVYFNPPVLLLALATSLWFLPMGVFASLWGDRYLSTSLRLTDVQGTTADAMIYLGFGIAAPFLGWLADKRGRRLGLMRGSLVLLALACVVQFWMIDAERAWWSFPVLFAFGFGCGGIILAFPLILQCTPAHAHGAGLTYLNFGQMALVFAGQWAVGGLLDHWAVEPGVYTRGDFQLAFSVLPTGAVAAFFMLAIPSVRAADTGSAVKGVVAH